MRDTICQKWEKRGNAPLDVYESISSKASATTAVIAKDTYLKQTPPGLFPVDVEDGPAEST